MSRREDSARLYTRMQNAERSETQRGQVDPQRIVGVFVLVVIAGPLAGAAFDIQSSLASTPAFSWFSAGVIAILIVAAVVVAALGFE